MLECDLTGLTAEPLADAEQFAPVGQYLQHWQGTVVLMRVPDPVLRSNLTSAGYADRMIILATWDSDALDDHRLLPHLHRTTLSLPSLPTAPAMARDFVARTLQDWQLPSLVAPASQVLSEFVTSSAVNASGDLDASLSRIDTRVRIAMANATADTTAALSDQPAYPLSGRGRQLVEGLTQAWGVIPGRPSGWTVWAVMDTRHETEADAAGARRHGEPIGRHRGTADTDVLTELHNRPAGRHRRDR